MKKSKKILFPTDFSEPAANAFHYALLLADKMEANIEILHIVYPQGESLDFPVLVAKRTQQKLEVDRIALKEFTENGIAQVQRQLKNKPNISSTMEVGSPIREIVRIAKQDDADLIIMGSRGANRTRFEKVLGSIAAGVVKKAHCPVIVVPEHTVFIGLDKIAYASNVLNSDPYELWKSLQLLVTFNPLVHLVHFNYKKEGDLNAYQELEDMASFLENRSPDSEVKIHNLPGKELKEDLNDFICKENVELLVMYQPEHSIWERLFVKSATKRMAIHSEVPLLVLKK